MSQEAVFIANAKSRKGTLLYEQALSYFAQYDINIIRKYQIQNPEEFNTAVQEEIKRNTPLIIVGGGDGTISSVVDYFIYTDSTLGIIPFGTTNNIARTLDIPLDLEGAVKNIATGITTHIDLAKVNGDYFTNVSTIGLNALIAGTVPHRLKKVIGRLAYVGTGMYILLTYTPRTYEIITDEKSEFITTHKIVVANGRFHGGHLIDPEAKADNRQLIVFTIGGETRWKFIKSLLAFVLGKHRDGEETFYATTKSVIIKTSKKDYMEIDGEIKPFKEARYSLSPDALKVIIHPSSDGVLNPFQ